MQNMLLADWCEVRHRLDKLEDHYSEILNLLSANTHPSHPASTAASQSTPVSAASSEYHASRAVHPVEGVQPISDDPVNKLMLTVAEGEALLDSYRAMSEVSFPYVLIPKSSTIHSLQMGHPLLLQAVLMVASWKDQTRQALLQNDFLKQISEKVVIQGEKSLDSLQALLVYCAWYHFYATQGIRPVYRYTALAVTMALDIGLDRRPTITTQHDMVINSSPSSAELHDPSVSKSWSYEAKRAFLGAYALSALFVSQYAEVTRFLSNWS
jgi:Fungal specific transcription factor domain